MKLSSQRNGIWGDILGRSMSKEYSFAEEHQPNEQPTAVQQQPPPTALQPRGVLDNSVFCAHGFNQVRTDVLKNSVVSLGAAMVSTIDEAARYPAPREPFYRFLIVPQDSQPDTHPHVDYDNIHIVTEFYIESCLHNKRFVDPDEHVLGRPFPLFPIPGFSDLAIGKAAFTGIELSQVARAITQLGARRDDDLRRSTSVLVCKSFQDMRKEKLHWALTWGVPIVSEDWLWECISTGYNVPVDNFIYPQIKHRYNSNDKLQEERKVPIRQESGLGGSTSKPASPALRPDTPEAAPEIVSKSKILPKNLKSKDDSPWTLKPKPIPKTSIDASVSMADFSTAQTHLVNSVADHQEPPPDGVAQRTDMGDLPARSSGPQRTRSEPMALLSMIAKDSPERAPSAPPADDQNQASDVGGTVLKAEEQKKQARAAEREQLSSKITSLIHSGTGSAGSPDTDVSVPIPRPRNRRILGRAVSNASNASSVASVEPSRPVPETFGVGEIADSQDESSEQPPATQLGYNYPEAQEYKAALLSGINGGMAEIKTEPPATASKGITGGGRSLRKR
jgi:hypothetical protein